MGVLHRMATWWGGTNVLTFRPGHRGKGRMPLTSSGAPLNPHLRSIRTHRIRMGRLSLRRETQKNKRRINNHQGSAGQLRGQPQRRPNSYAAIPAVLRQRITDRGIRAPSAVERRKEHRSGKRRKTRRDVRKTLTLGRQTRKET